MGITTYGLPPFKKATDTETPLLLIILADLDNGDKASLVQHFQNSIQGSELKISTWHPSIRILEQVANQGPYRDSQANIHAVAILARRAGWDSVLVADNLTKRHLQGNLRVGDSPLLSVVMVAIRPATAQENEVRVIARRTTGSAPDNAELLPILRTFKPEKLPPGKCDIYRDGGMILHDPDRSMLTPDTTARLGREELLRSMSQMLATNIPLPMELVTDIMTRATSGRETRATLPSWMDHNSKHLNIFIGFPATTEELSNIQATLDNAAKTYIAEKISLKCPKIPITLIPWEHHRAASRRQLLDLWEEYQSHLREDIWAYEIYVLLKPIERATNIQLGTISYNMREPAYLSLQTLDRIIRATGFCDSFRFSNGSEVSYRPREYELQHHETDDNELMFPPSRPFYHDPVRWRPTQRGLNCVPMFYLTRNITPEQDEAIKAEIRTLGEVDQPESGDKLSIFVPWEGDEPDGTLDDVWKIFWEVNRHNRRTGSRFPIFFIDHLTLVDNTVLLVEPDYVFYGYSNPVALEMLEDVTFPEIRGFQYMRLPGRGAHFASARLSLANMNHYESGEIYLYPRPDWPGHGVLESDDDDC
ncbi:hypothetical protein BO70DRAFT_359500 [Aspergillus heteromorphus CBS 117.55]|uniref:Uncharacterized protein n=1 Tax=Aspergillus heteromorphus CBS 117.55 TaxID=1448321 RepID=A0A317WSY8_9EURO|nr:uncharacterized protein BO70DRAFT_359500 [Aspergillus heteromorphus CBS 117.55]PWY89215.1 hypothetical protein BO70DRAFT_359500 [Aspergillus heteromorphus CBS 117.55]